MKYYASKKYKIACKEGCYHIKNIKAENLIEYDSKESALNDGCKVCKDCLKKCKKIKARCIDKNPYPTHSFRSGLVDTNGQPVWGTDVEWFFYEIKHGRLPPIERGK